MTDFPGIRETAPVAPVVRAHWQLRMSELLLLVTSVAVFLGITIILASDFGAHSPRLNYFPVVAAVCGATLLNLVAYRLEKRRAGRLLCQLRRRTTLKVWAIDTWIPIAAAAAAYLIPKTFHVHHGGASESSMLMLWLFATASIINLVYGFVCLQESGIVTSMGLVIALIRWTDLHRRAWRFENGNLVIGSGWSRISAEVLPQHQAVVAAVLKQKLGLEASMAQKVDPKSQSASADHATSDKGRDDRRT